MGRLVFAVSLVMAVMGLITGFFYDLYSTSYLSILIIVAAFIALFALYVTAFGDEWNTYVPTLLLVACGLGLLDTTTGFPSGGVQYAPSFLSAATNTTLVFMAVTGLVAMATWRISDEAFDGWHRFAAATTMYALLSVIASRTGVVLELWDAPMMLGIPSGYTQVIGGVIAGAAYAANGDLHEPKIPLFAEHVLSAFVGFLAGVIITEGHIAMLVVTHLVIIGHLVNMYAR